MPPPPRPPDRTIRYRIKTSKFPDDLSNAFFTRTQVAHTKCFKAGDYIVVGLASEADVELHTLPAATESLKLLGFELVESQERLSARTVLARRIDDYLFGYTKDDLITELKEKNDLNIDDLTIIPRAHMFKLKLSTKQQADKVTTTGLKLFSQIIPYYNTNVEEHIPVTQCLKCYKFDHRTNQCKATTSVCSKCAATGHTHTQCSATTLKCLNCEGDHPAVSFKCPEKLKAQKEQNAPPAPTRFTFAQAASSPNTPAPSTPPTTPNPAPATTQNTNKTPSLAENIVTYATITAQGDLKVQSEMVADLFAANGLQVIHIPPNFHSKYQQHFADRFAEKEAAKNTPPPNPPQGNEETGTSPTSDTPQATTTTTPAPPLANTGPSGRKGGQPGGKPPKMTPPMTRNGTAKITQHKKPSST